MTLHRFSTMQEAEEFFAFYQRETVTAWRVYCVDKRLAKGNTASIKELQKGKVRIQWSLTVGKGVSVEFDGIPFVFVGAKRWMCHMGKDVDIRKKEKLRALSEQRRKVDASFKPRQKWQSSKKIDCPAMAYLTHIIKFPGYQLAEEDHDKIRAKRQIAVELREDILVEKEMQIEHQYIIKVPDAVAHDGHVTREANISPRTSLKVEIAHPGHFPGRMVLRDYSDSSILPPSRQQILVEVVNGPKKMPKPITSRKRKGESNVATCRYRCVMKWKAIQDAVYRIDDEGTLMDLEDNLNHIHEDLMRKEMELDYSSSDLLIEVKQTAVSLDIDEGLDE